MKTNPFTNRLADFTCRIIKFSEKLPYSQAKLTLNQQITRSSISVSLNFAEAQGAESRKDFIHKMNLSLKELRETNMALIIVSKLYELKYIIGVEKIQQECDELIAIFVKSINTAKRNQTKSQ